MRYILHEALEQAEGLEQKLLWEPKQQTQFWMDDVILN